MKNPGEVRTYLRVPLANALRAFTSLRSAGAQRNLLGVLQGTTEILLKSRRMGAENAIINPSKLNCFAHSVAALQLPSEPRFLAELSRTVASTH